MQSFRHHAADMVSGLIIVFPRLGLRHLFDFRDGGFVGVGGSQILNQEAFASGLTLEIRIGLVVTRAEQRASLLDSWFEDGR